MNSSTAFPHRALARLRAPGIAGVSLLIALAGVAPASASIAPPMPATVASADDEDASSDPLEVTLSNDGVAIADATTATFDIANDTGEEYSESTIAVSVGSALGDEADVDAWLAGGAGGAMNEVATVDVGAVPTGTSLSATATLPLEDMPDGVYPVVATYGGGSNAIEQRDVVIVSRGGTGDVALVVPITGPVTTRGLYSESALATLMGSDGLLTAQLDAVAETDAILAVDPAIPAAVRALGDAAPPEATEWLDRLMSLDNDRFALQFADADVSPQVAAGLDTPLVPTHLGAFLDDSAKEDEPSLHSLTRIGSASTPTMFWPAPGTATPDTVEALAAGGSARVLVPASSTTDGSAALGDDALAYDDELSDALLAAAEESDAEARERALTVATTQIWRAAMASDAPLLLALDRMGSDALTTNEDGATIADAELSLSAEGLDAAVHAATGTAAATTAGLDDVLAAASGSVAIRDTEPDAARQAAVETYLDARGGLDHIATALVNPDLFTGQVRSELHQVLSVAWTTNPEGWRERADAFADLNADRAVAIDLQDQQPVQLLSAEAPMPVWIRNDLPFPARVTVVAVPDDPRLSIERRTEVTAQPDSVTRTTIPIEARVGSGDVTVHYSLEAQTGDRIGPTRDLQVTVRAEWERIGIGILVVLVAGLFGLGTFRQIRRRRRQAAKYAGSDIQESDA